MEKEIRCVNEQRKTRTEIRPHPVRKDESRIFHVAEIDIHEDNLRALRAVTSRISEAQVNDKGIRLDAQEVSILERFLTRAVWDLNYQEHEFNQEQEAIKLLKSKGYEVK